MKKRILAVMILVGLALVPSAKALASTNSNAWSVGAKYSEKIGDIDTRSDAKTAADYYGSLGYNSYYSYEPTYQIMRGQFQNGYKRMESAIQFYSGHGNYDHIAFNANNLGGDYKTGVYYGSDFDSSTGYKYAGVQSYDFSGVKLITFAACDTASTDDNICKRAYDNGAKTTIGWTKTVGAGSHTNWLKRYNDYLNKGYTVKQSAAHADSYSYVDKNVKAYKIYGDENLKLTKQTKGIKVFSKTGERKPSYKVSFTDETVLYSEMAKRIKGFDIKEYDICHTENGLYLVIDLEKQLDGIRTTEGYTIIVENDMASIYQNSVSTDEELTFYGVTVDSFSEDIISYIEANTGDTSMVSKDLLTGMGDCNIILQEDIYDTKENKVKTYFQIESVLEDGGTAIIEYIK